MRKKVVIPLLFCILAMFLNACITVETLDKDASSVIAVTESKEESKKEIKKEIKKESQSHNDSKDEDYVGSWSGFGMIGNDEKFISLPDNMWNIIIRANGSWSMTVERERDDTIKFSGDWKIEKLNGEDALSFYDSGIKAAIGSLNNDGTLGLIFILADAETYILFEKD